MKIIHIVHNFYGFSGASLQAKNLANAISKYDPAIEQIFVTRKDDNKKDRNDNNEKVIQIPVNLKRMLSFFILCLKVKPDIAHFHGTDFGLLIVCRILKIKVYWKSTLLGSDDFDSLIGTTTRGIIKKGLIKLIDINNTLTQQIKEINSRYLPPSRLITIPNGVEKKDFLEVNRDKVVLIISALIPRKKVIEGIEFFKSYFAPYEYKLRIYGPSDSTLDGYNAEYVNSCFSFADENIEFMGNVKHEEITKALGKSLFLIHLSDKEGMPNVVLEALSNAVYPIVSPMNGLAKEIIESETYGYIISDDMTFDANNYEGINIEGAKVIEKKYAFNIIAEKTHEIYKLLLGEK